MTLTERILAMNSLNPDWSAAEIALAAGTTRKYVTVTLRRYERTPRLVQFSNPAAAFNERHMPEPNSGCWLWLGSLSTSGYGRMTIGRRQVQAHRVAYEMNKGPIPDGMELLHRCDNPICVNPAHLTPGTHQDNMRDMYRKGRKGLLSPADAEAIRASTENRTALAERYGVSLATIKKVRSGHYYNRKEWEHAV